MRNVVRHPLTWVWAAVALLGAIVAVPMGVEAFGSLKLTTHRDAVIAAYSYTKGQQRLVDEVPSVEQFTLHFSGGDTHVVLENQPVLGLGNGDTVDAGFVVGRIATIDGRFVSTLSVLVTLLFVWFCSLLAHALWLTGLAPGGSRIKLGWDSPEHEHDDEAASALFVTACMSLIGAIPIFFVTIALQFWLRLPGWPLLVIGLSFGGAWVLRRRYGQAAQ